MHLASFSGNIGDNANHSGFRPWLESFVSCKVEWTDLEIREYYWKERRFDDSFLELVSNFNLLVIGGGNYFELWVEESSTGTSIDIPLDIFSKIKIPILFNALGCDEGQGSTDKSLGKFTRFLQLLASSSQYLITVRNDGAMNTLQKNMPPTLLEKVFVIPDGGFFLDFTESIPNYLDASKKRIGINLACDMGEIRFRNFDVTNGYDMFCDEFAKMLEMLAEEDPEIHYFFFPHIFQDLKIIADVISRMNDRLRRTRVATAPYLIGAEGAKHIFGLYHHCELFIGMRFHANVCAIGMGLPVIGLCNYIQIDYLYEELNHPTGCFNIRNPGFSLLLRKKILASLSTNQLSKESARIMNDVKHLRKSFDQVLINWLQCNSLLEKV